MALSDLSVRKFKPSEKPYKKSDARGLHIEVRPNGSKLWRLNYRYGGKQKTLALGSYPEVSLAEARSKRDEARYQLRENIDPAQARKATKANSALAGNNFETVAREWHAEFSYNWTTSHASKVIRRFELYIFPWLGREPIGEISPPSLLSKLRQIESTGKLETAHRTLRHCSQVFRYGIATGRCERDPAGDLRGALPPYKKDKHLAAITEPDRIGELLRVLDRYNGTLPVASALKLAPLVFVRPGELRQAEWRAIDLQSATWNFSASKTGQAHVVPLSTQAVQILSNLYPLTGHGRYVFPSARNPRGDRPMSDNAVLSALRRLDIPKDEMSGHGFRAMARTVLDEVLGYRPDYIEHQLAHAVRDPNGRAYNRTAHLPERREMMQAWADYLDKLKCANSEVSDG